MLKKFSLIIPLSIFGVLAERIYNASFYACRKKTFALIVSNYFTLAFSLTVALFPKNNSYRSRNTVLVLFGVLFFIANLIINSISFGTFIDEFLDPSICVKKSDRIFLIVVFVSVICAFIFGIVFICIGVIQRRHQVQRQRFIQMNRDPELLKNEMIRRNLNSIYNAPRFQSRDGIERFMNNPETVALMVKLPPLAVEIRLMKTHFLIKMSDEKLSTLFQKDDKHCVVCYSEFSNDCDIFEFDCAHYFHENCILEWLKIRVSCPTCRSNLRHGLVRRIFKNTL